MSDKNESESVKTILTALAITVVMTPINAFIYSWTMSKFWEWFLKEQFGEGPSFGAWFGINMILSVIIGEKLIIIAKDKDWDKTKKIIGRAVALPFIYGSALIMSYGVGLIMGWIKG